MGKMIWHVREQGELYFHESKGRNGDLVLVAHLSQLKGRDVLLWNNKLTTFFYSKEKAVSLFEFNKRQLTVNLLKS